VALVREVTLHKELLHPHIIRLYNSFREGTTLYIILEYMENGNIFKLIRERAITVDMAVKIFAQMIGALAYFHAKNIIHRDIKPENILWNKAGRFKLSDFGFCGNFLETGGRKTMCGTTEYIAPEVILSDAQTDRLDIWCMGILLFEMLHFRAPYQVKNTYWLMQEIQKRKVECDPHLPKDLRDIIHACLQIQPPRRPTAQQLIDSYPIVRQNLDTGTGELMPSPIKGLADPSGGKTQDRFNFKKQRGYGDGNGSGSNIMNVSANNGSSYSNHSTKGVAGVTATKPVQPSRPMTNSNPNVGIYLNPPIKHAKESSVYAHKFHFQLPREQGGPTVYTQSSSLNSTQESKKVSSYSNEGTKTYRESVESQNSAQQKQGLPLTSARPERTIGQPPVGTKRSAQLGEGPRPGTYVYSNTVASNTFLPEVRSEQKATFETPPAKGVWQASQKVPFSASNLKEYPEARLYTESNQGMLMKRMGDLNPTNPQFVNIYHRSQNQSDLFRTQMNNKPAEFAPKMVRAGSLTSSMTDPSAKDYMIKVTPASPAQDLAYPTRTMENFRYSVSHADAKMNSSKPKQGTGNEYEDRMRRVYSAEKLKLLAPTTSEENQFREAPRLVIDKYQRGPQVTVASTGSSPRKLRTTKTEEGPSLVPHEVQGVNIRSISRGHTGTQESTNTDSRRFLFNPFAPRK
jgi:serine/threonine protein kinase